MKLLPKILSNEEAEWWGLPTMIPDFPPEEILFIESKWSKKALQRMAEENFLDPGGDKEALVSKLMYVGALDSQGEVVEKPAKERAGEFAEALPQTKSKGLSSPWIDKDYSLSHPLTTRELQHSIVFHGTSKERLSLIAQRGLCPSIVTSVREWVPSDPEGVYVNSRSAEAYHWGGQWPVVLAILRKDIPPQARIYYDWNMPIARTEKDLRRSGQDYVIVSDRCIQPVYTLVSRRVDKRFKIQVVPLTQALEADEVGLVDKWQLQQFDKSVPAEVLKDYPDLPQTKKPERMPRINPHASAIKQDEQLREQMRWLKKHGFKTAREAQEAGY